MKSTFLRNYMHVNDGQLQLVYDPADHEQAYLIHVATRYYQVFKLPSWRIGGSIGGTRPARRPADPRTGACLAEEKNDTDVMLPSERLRFQNSVIPASDGTTSFLVRVAIPLSPADAARRGFLRSLLFLAPVGVIFAALVGWQLTKRALRPMKNLAAAARNINIQQLQQRLPVRGAGDEVDDVAQAFNDTLARLENSVEQMKQFTASISHELRTPLTALRGEAEVALLEAHSVEEYRRVLASQLEEFDKLTQMVNQFLVLGARRSGRDSLDRSKRGPFGAGRVARRTDGTDRRREKASIWKTQITPGIIVRGDSNWLERVILNLLDNAHQIYRGSRNGATSAYF